MTDERSKRLIESLRESLLSPQENPIGTVAILILETIKYRDRLKQETGRVLTVEDTRIALDAFEGHLHGKPLAEELTDDQRHLAQTWIDRLTRLS